MTSSEAVLIGGIYALLVYLLKVIHNHGQRINTIETEKKVQSKIESEKKIDIITTVLTEAFLSEAGKRKAGVENCLT